MNNKAEVGPIGAIMLFIVFLIVFLVALVPFNNDIGTQAVSTNGLTGFEAFFFEHWNLCIVICMFLGMLGWAYFGGQK